MFDHVKRWVVRVARAAPIALAICATIACGGDADAFVTIEGRVVDAATSDPIDSAIVLLISREQGTGSVFTAPDGSFTMISIEKGRTSMRVSKEGYDPFDTVFAALDHDVLDLTIELNRH